MRKNTLVFLITFFSTISVFSQVYGTLSGKIIKGGDETGAIIISDPYASTFIETLYIVSADENVGMLSFSWQSKRTTRDVVDTTVTLPIDNDKNFFIKWGPKNPVYDNQGNEFTEYKIISGNVRIEKVDKTIRFFFNITAELQGTQMEFREGKFEYTLLN